MLVNTKGSVLQYFEASIIYGAAAEPIVPAAELAPNAKALTVTGNNSVK